MLAQFLEALFQYAGNGTQLGGMLWEVLADGGKPYIATVLRELDQKWCLGSGSTCAMSRSRPDSRVSVVSSPGLA